MKRGTIRIVICVILGVVTTVGVAWCGSILRRPQYYVIFGGPDEGPRYSAIAFRNGLSVRVWTIPTFPIRTEFDDMMTLTEDSLWIWMLLGHEDAQSVSFEFDIPVALPPLPESRNARPREFLWVERSGWPLSSMGAAFVCTQVQSRIALREGAISLDDLREARGNHAILPLRPIFPGFIVNTLFYAAVWFVLFFGFSALRRAIRRKRGRCPRCAYDLRGSVTNGQDARSTRKDARSTGRDARSTGCPECGWNRSEPRP